MVRHIPDWPGNNETTYLRDSADAISTIVTLLPSGRYLIESFTRNVLGSISHISTTISFWTSYI